MIAARLALVACLALLGFSGTASAGSQGKPTGVELPGAAKLSKADAASRRARWNKLTKEEQAELLARHKRLESLSPEKRAELENRAKRVQRELAEIEASLTEEELADLDKLGRKERQSALRKMVAERASVAAAMVRTRMTPKERARVEAAKPEERAEMLRVFRKRELDRLSGSLFELAKELGFSAAKLDELRKLPHHDQRTAIISRMRRRLERDVSEKGLPEGLPEKRWKRMCSQGDMGFLRSVEKVRSQHPEFGVPAKQWDRRVRRRKAIASRLRDLGEPSDRQRERSPNATDSQLRRRMIIDRRQRIEQFLIRECHLGTGVARRLEALSPQEFVAAVGVGTKLIEEGADVGAGLDRWLDARQRRREGKKR